MSYKDSVLHSLDSTDCNPMVVYRFSILYISYKLLVELGDGKFFHQGGTQCLVVCLSVMLATIDDQCPYLLVMAAT